MIDWLNNLSDTQQFALFRAVKIVAAFAVLMTIVAYVVWSSAGCARSSRTASGRTASGPSACCSRRPTRIKAFLKEEFTPAHVRKIYFFLAPAIALIPAILNLAIIPFGSQIGKQKMVIANLNVGILYTFGIVSLGVYGIVLAGYAANSKYPFLGGIRSSAQMISYEIAMGLAVIPVFLLVGSLNLNEVIGYQTGAAVALAGVQAAAGVRHLPGRGICRNQPHAIRPAGSRAGTGRRLQRRIQLHQIRAVFHGRIREHDPRVGDDGDAVLRRLDAAVVRAGPAGGEILCMASSHIAIFLAKVLVFLLLFIWVRWMWPRFRYDQLMDLGWRRFLPLALANIVVTAAILWLRKLK